MGPGSPGTRNEVALAVGAFTGRIWDHDPGRSAERFEKKLVEVARFGVNLSLRPEGGNAWDCLDVTWRSYVHLACLMT